MTRKPTKPYTGGPGISKKQMNTLIRFFVRDELATVAADEARVARNTVNLWYRHFRERIYQASRRAPRFFGEVEMDQAEFGGRGHKRMQALLKRLKKTLPYAEFQKKQKEVRSEHKVKVFGILQRGGKVYVQIISRMDARTLIPIVRLVVEDKTIFYTQDKTEEKKKTVIYTDMWRAFSKLGLDGYVHKTVNHSEEYVNQKGDHINGIESFWAFVKKRLTKFNGIARTTLPLHLKECEWRWNIGAEERGVTAKKKYAIIAAALKELLK